MNAHLSNGATNAHLLLHFVITTYPLTYHSAVPLQVEDRYGFKRIVTFSYGSYGSRSAYCNGPFSTVTFQYKKVAFQYLQIPTGWFGEAAVRQQHQ